MLTVRFFAVLLMGILFSCALAPALMLASSGEIAFVSDRDGKAQIYVMDGEPPAPYSWDYWQGTC